MYHRSVCIGEAASCSSRSVTQSRHPVVVYAKKRGSKSSYQKNEGVYFEYVTATEAEKIVVDDDGGQFGWVKQARQSHKRLQKTKERTSAASRPPPPRPRTDSSKAAGRQAPKSQRQRARTQPPAATQQPGTPGPTAAVTAPGPAPSPTTTPQHAAARAAIQQQVQHDLAVLLAASGLRQEDADEDDDVAVGTCYDEDDPLERQLAAIEADPRMTPAQKGRAKMRLLGFDPEPEEGGGAGSGGPPVASHGIATTTGAAGAGSGPVQLLGRPARKPAA